MKKFALVLASLGIAAASLPATAQAAPGDASIAGRQATIDARIDQGIRTGALTRPEAVRLRTEFRNLRALELRYQHSGGGLNPAERRDLERRYDLLSAKVRVQKHDVQHRR